MRSKRILCALGTFTGMAIVTLVGAFAVAPSLRADDRDRWDHEKHDHDRDDDDARVDRGLRIAPVPLTYSHRNRRRVGIGSYIVNTTGCNGCHSAGPTTEWAPGGNPFFLPGAPPPRFNGIKAVNPATYLGGGRDFSFVGAVDIVSRNLTPDISGRPIGGASFAEFSNSIRHGIDADALHPVMAFPFDGTKLQVMPWPSFQDWTEDDLKSVYEYLKAIPCIPGTPTPGVPPTRDMTTHLCP